MNETIEKQLPKGRFLLHFPANNDNDTGEMAVLVHGLVYNGFLMCPMARFLARNGYEAFCYDHRTTRGTVDEHARVFKSRLEELVRQYPGRPVNIITHSLGGLVVGQALKHLSNWQGGEDELLNRGKIKKIVMMAPPNRGSKVASAVMHCIPGISKLSQSLPELSFGESSPMHKIPVPCGIPLGVIAASRDLLVPRCSTALDTQCDYVMVASGHSYMMLRPKIMQQVLSFLKSGRFGHQAPEVAA